MQNYEDKRAYPRMPTDLAVRVHGLDAEGRPFIDETHAHDLSGGGFAIYAAVEEHYFVGQRLAIDFLLPALCHPKHDRLLMRATGSVVRIILAEPKLVCGTIDDILDLAEEGRE